jgi:glycine betaine transporter
MPLKLIMGIIFLLLMVILYWVIYYSALTGINKVIKFLADFDFTFSIILMLFIALFLKYFYVSNFYCFLQLYHSFFEMSLSLGSYKTSETFTQEWIFYWAFG